MKTVEARIKNNMIESVSLSEMNIQLPSEKEGQELDIWIHEQLEKMGFLMEGDNLKVTYI